MNTEDAPKGSRAAGSIVTRRGDGGSTGLLYGGPRISKDDPRIEACGTIDEAVAALGLARAALPTSASVIADIVLRLQRELFVAGAELATSPTAADRARDGYTRISATMVAGLDALVEGIEHSLDAPSDFVIPGATGASAALELARTVIRRAERRAVALVMAGLVPNDQLIAYLNRLGDLVWLLARAAEREEGRPAETLGALRERAEG